MPSDSEVAASWRDKAIGFFSSSGVRLKEAGKSAGSFVGNKAKDAGENVVDAASTVGSFVKNRWRRAQLQKSMQKRHAATATVSIPDRVLSATSSALGLIRDGISETKKKVVAGKMKVEEVAKKTEDKSENILNNIKRWQKGVASADVFGMPIEAIVERQQFVRPIPQILDTCAKFLVSSGLNSEYLFKAEGDKKVLQHLILLYNQDWNASLPKDINAIDVAALVKYYLFSLPEPLTTFALYHEFRNASSIHDLRSILKKLPDVNYNTLEIVTSLLLQVSQKSLLNKFYREMIDRGFAPDSYSFVGLLNSFCMLHGIHHALNAYYVIVSNNHNVDAYVHSAILDRLIKERRCDIAIQLFRRAVRENYCLDVVCCTIVIDGLFRSNRSQEACSLFEQMKHSGPFPSFRTYNAMLYGLCKRRDLDAVSKLLTDMEIAGFEMDLISFNLVLGLLIKLQRLNSALLLLSKMYEFGLEPNAVTYSLLLKVFSCAPTGQQNQLFAKCTPVIEDRISLSSSKCGLHNEILECTAS